MLECHWVNHLLPYEPVLGAPYFGGDGIAEEW
jgi:hypothetical protein